MIVFEKLEILRNKKILVLGDLMLDEYEYGEVSRISPEAPVQIVKFTHSKKILGGAGNTANNLVSLGAEVYLSGVIGKDGNTELVLDCLKKANISSEGIIQDETRPTTIKKRIVSGKNQLLRIDYEEKNPISTKIQEKIKKFIKNKIDIVDAIVVSDYNKGLITKELMNSLLELANEKNKPTILDGKPENLECFKRVTLITPNLIEAKQMSQIKDDIEKIGKVLVDKIEANVFLTRGADGITVFEKNGKITHVPTKKVPVYDVTGAGDTVVAISALGLASGMNLLETAELANIAGRIVVQKSGTATVTIDELKAHYRDDISLFLREGIEVKQRVLQEQINEIDQIAKILINAFQNGNKVLAFGNGGSATDAQHLVGEIVGRFKIERKPFPAMALTSDSMIVTAIANDYGYDKIFERQIEAATQPGDVVIGITTSGKSLNVLNGMKKAQELGAKTIGLTGKDGGTLPDYCDVCLIVPSNNTPRIQETHMVLIHIICELLEKELATLLKN